MAVKKKKKKDQNRVTVRLHEKNVAFKHNFSVFGFILKCSIVLFFLILFIVLEFDKNYYVDERGTIIELTIFVAIVIYSFMGVRFYNNRIKPNKLIAYDTKFRWFKVYNKKAYHIVRPDDITRLDANTLCKVSDNFETKEYGFIRIYAKVYVRGKLKQAIKKFIIFCTDPKEVKLLLDECIEDKRLYDEKIASEAKMREDKAAAKQAVIDRNTRQAEELEKAKGKAPEEFMDVAIEKGKEESLKEDILQMETVADAMEIAEKHKND